MPWKDFPVFKSIQFPAERIFTQHDALFPNDVQSPSKHPSLLVNDSGVFLLTCRDHSVKINKQYKHLPEHTAGRIFSPFADRFAPAVLNTRSMKPFRENYSTASYKMLKLIASFAGLNTFSCRKIGFLIKFLQRVLSMKRFTYIQEKIHS